jgi:hypothetical protein
MAPITKRQALYAQALLARNGIGVTRDGDIDAEVDSGTVSQGMALAYGLPLPDLTDTLADWLLCLDTSDASRLIERLRFDQAAGARRREAVSA